MVRFNWFVLISEDLTIPHRIGKIREINKFDGAFFGIPFRKAEEMDPQGRLALEKAYEAIVDAGKVLKKIHNRISYV